MTEFDYRAKAMELNVSDMNDALLKASVEADFTLILKGEIIHPDVLKKIEKNAVWNFDCWNCEEEWFIGIAKAAKVFFTPCGGMISKFRGMGINAHWLIEGCAPKYHKPTPSDGTLKSDITFIGTVQGIPEREPWLRAIARRFPNRLNVWGSFGVQIPNVIIHGRPTGEDNGHNMVVSATKINLDYSRRPDIQGGFSARIFRTLAAGGFLLMKRVEGIEDILIPGVHLETFQTDSECINKIAYYLENEPEHRLISKNGMQEVLANHTFTERAKRMLAVIK